MQFWNLQEEKMLNELTDAQIKVLQNGKYRYVRFVGSGKVNDFILQGTKDNNKPEWIEIKPPEVKTSKERDKNTIRFFEKQVIDLQEY